MIEIDKKIENVKLVIYSGYWSNNELKNLQLKIKIGLFSNENGISGVYNWIIHYYDNWIK